MQKYPSEKLWKLEDPNSRDWPSLEFVHFPYFDCNGQMEPEKAVRV